jgi:hypothetical protein
VKIVIILILPIADTAAHTLIETIPDKNMEDSKKRKTKTMKRKNKKISKKPASTDQHRCSNKDRDRITSFLDACTDDHYSE